MAHLRRIVPQSPSEFPFDNVARHAGQNLGLAVRVSIGGNGNGIMQAGN